MELAKEHNLPQARTTFIINHSSLIIKKTLLRNFFHLSLLRGINMLSPFVLYPYLIRTVGMEYFGHITVAFAVSTYLSLVGDYGFQQSAVRETAANREDHQRISNLYWTVTLAKPVLVLGTALVMFLISCALTSDWRISLVYISGFFIALGEAMTPVWFFQGMEKMQNLVYSNLLTRILGLLLVVLFVREASDYVWAMPMLGIGTLAGAALSNFYLLPRAGAVLPLSACQLGFKNQFKSGYPFFLRNVALSAYAQIPVFILKAHAPAAVVGHFGVADRIVAMLKAVLAAFSVAIFPPLVALKPKGHAALVEYVRKYFRPYLAAVVVGSGVLFVFAEPIIRWYSGSDPAPIVPVLRAMAFLPISLALIQPMDAFMQVYGREKLISVFMIAVGVLNFLMNLYLIPHHMAFGAALSLYLTETVLFFLFLWFFERKYRKEAYYLRTENN
jgi:polysaccharide transporter, PST family